MISFIVEASRFQSQGITFLLRSIINASIFLVALQISKRLLTRNSKYLNIIAISMSNLGALFVIEHRLEALRLNSNNLSLNFMLSNTLYQVMMMMMSTLSWKFCTFNYISMWIYYGCRY